MKTKKKILWLGSYQSEELFLKMLAKNIGQASSFASQKGLIKGLDAILDTDTALDTIGVISYPTYPIYPQKKVKREEWKRRENSRDVCVGYGNIKYLTYLSRARALKKEVKLWAKTETGTEENTVFIYEPSVAKLKSALYLKKRFGAKVFVIIPDIPKFVNLGAGKILKMGKHLAEKTQKKLFKQVDGFILYSAHMASYYGFEEGRWILMEGVFDPSEAEISAEEKQNDGTLRMMYCGALTEFRGIPQLLDAFDTLRDRPYELWLTGAGGSDSLIKERAAADPRIRHFGYLDSRNDVLKLQSEADILIHTRDVNAPSSPYCFPSKIFEYLVTQKPVISVRIPGIPDEYFNYMTPIETLTADGIRDALRTVAQMSTEERATRGKAAREFVLTQKNSTVQAQKIMDFVKSKE